jgi:glucose-1-phosphate adenylyltransferase
MDLRKRVPPINVYNRSWRIRTAQRDYPPARFLLDGESRRAADIVDSVVCEGSIISGARLHDVLLGYDCFVHSGSEVRESVILSGCDIGHDARLRRVLLDKNCKIEPGVTIGFDAESDLQRFPFVTPSGLVVLPKGTTVPVKGPIQLANDIEELLANDPDTRVEMEKFRGRFTVSPESRHSYLSAGPRFERFGRPPA